MFITMHCGGMPFDGNTVNEKSLGGSETAAYHVAKELAARGHHVSMFTSKQIETDSPDGAAIFDGVRYLWAGEVNEQFPLGANFTHYAENSPHDVLIIQRHPAAFKRKWASKINLWWTHDLAIYNTAPVVNSMMWNVDGVLCVSQYHKDQLRKVYGLTDEIIYPITNAIDPELYTMPRDFDANPFLIEKYHNGTVEHRINLLYSSRPERGLEHLVKPDGIMHKLSQENTNHHLYVCGYENTTAQMAEFYSYLKACCEYLPNVTYLGALTKQELADVQRQCDLWIYPTAFEEVSCITAMEAMAAGMDIIASKHAALPETLNHKNKFGKGFKYKAHLIPLKDGEVDEDVFTKALKKYVPSNQPGIFPYTWDKVAEQVEGITQSIFDEASCTSKVRELIRTSDIYALSELSKTQSAIDNVRNKIQSRSIEELLGCYDFAFSNTWSEHYQAYYQYEKDRGVEYGPEKLDGNNRFEHVSGWIGHCKPGRALDYGCAHGHYTINLAKRFPDTHFVGVDITESNVEKARRWAEEEGLTNVEFIQGSLDYDSESGGIGTIDGVMLDQFDFIIAAEVIEHIGNPQYFIESLVNEYLKEGGIFLMTTPCGGWESQGYKQHHPWRAHVHHFERADLHDMLDHCKNFNVVVAPSGQDRKGDVLGSYITTFNKEGPLLTGAIDYKRKFATMNPRQTVSLCMIVKNGENTLRRTLESIKDVIDEVIISVDSTTTDKTQRVIEDFNEDNPLWPVVSTQTIDSPLKTGFAAARNSSISGASGDWVMWLDADETVEYANEIPLFLRNNEYTGYMINQHHMSIDPPVCLQTDKPTRLFRNGKGIQFFGLVHEHPEIKMNDGIGQVTILPKAAIGHYGYSSEFVRRNRFNRNVELMWQDRLENPSRKLGKFLWVRDLALMNQYERENNGNQITPDIVNRSNEGVQTWFEILEPDTSRFAIEGLGFYSEMAKVVATEGVAADLSITASVYGTDTKAPVQVKGYFYNKEHLQKFVNLLLDVQVEDHDRRYIA